MKFTKSDIQRFENLLQKNVNEKGCWLWTGTYKGAGYGAFWTPEKSWRAHRAAYTIWRGEIPTGKLILHSCHIRKCCNPDHLRIGTHKENMMDLRLSQNRLKKTTPEMIIEIRQMLESGFTQKSIGIQYSLSQAYISGIANGRYMSHLQ